VRQQQCGRALLRRAARRQAWPAGLLAATPGPGTAENLRAAGVAAGSCRRPMRHSSIRIALGALARLARPQRSRRARRRGRDWLVERLIDAGAKVDAVAAGGSPPALSPSAAVDAAFAAPASTPRLFSGSRRSPISGARRHLDRAGSRALATHPRIAARARQAGFAEVFEVHPGLDAVVACIQSMQP
jgi:uroporphyrinogen-III synthase